MKYRSKHHYSPVDELNREQEASLINPFKVLAVSTFLVPAGIATILHYKVAIDTFAMKHPILTGWLLVLSALTGMVLIVRKMMW